jgi:flagellar motor switch protein FliN/FliY
MFKLFNPYQGLSLRLSEEPLTTKESYCIELALSIDNIQSICRIILPLSFQHLFKEFYSTKKVPLKERLNFDQIPLICQLTLGSTVLKKQILDNLQIGDLLILDHASYQPKNKKGYFKLSYKHLPLFQVKLKEDQLKILDFISSGEDSYMDETDDMDHMDDMEEMAHLDEMGQEEDFDEMENNRSSFQEELMIDPSKVDLTVFCEVGKFEINLENLLQLKPGSIVPLSKRPEEGVYLTLNQKKIARGELVQLGDAVGVKITQTY